MNKKSMPLHTKIMIGLILGIIVGLLLPPSITTYIKPLGMLFLKLIKMLVVPLVFASLVLGIVSLGNIRELGRIGLKTIIYYMLTTMIAISIGLILANILSPGKGLSESAKDKIVKKYNTSKMLKKEAKHTNLLDQLIDIVPDNPFDTLSKGKMLQLIFIAIFFGIGITMIEKRKGKLLTIFFDGINDIMLWSINIVMELAPLGVFALMAALIGQFGSDILLPLLKYSLIVLLGLFLHIVITYGSAVRLIGKMSFIKFIKGIQDAILIAFTTSSSAATLPVTMKNVEENLGIPPKLASFILPLGATINMDGTALYQGVATIFIAQIYGIQLDFASQLSIVVTATLASIGAAGVPSAGIITLTLILTNLNIPLEGIALILGVDRLLDMFRTIVNITGDSTATVVVNELEKGRV